MQVAIKHIPEMRVAAVAHVGPYPTISKAFATLGAIAGAAGLIGPQSTMLGLYYDDPNVTAESELRSAASITIDPGVAIPAGLAEELVAGGRYAVATHIGPYDLLGRAWSLLRGEWLEGSGEAVRPSGVCFEIYRNIPGSVPPEKLMTELYLPLEDR